jgi:hypothetical protein
MPKSTGYSHPFIGSKSYLAKKVVEFEKVREDENFMKLFYFINSSSTELAVPNADYLGSLSSKMILQNICHYSSKESAKFNHAMTNKEKLFLLYGLYHNYLWRTFDQLYNPMVEGSKGDYCAGGCPYSQDYLMIMCKDLIKEQEHKQQKAFYSAFLEELEVIRDRLHAEKEAIRWSFDQLKENDVVLSKITFIVDDDNFNKKYFASVKLECKAEIHFTYRAEDQIVLSPIVGAHEIDIKKLRNIIDKIFKIPTIVQMSKIPTKRGRLKKNSEKGRLY